MISYATFLLKYNISNRLTENIFNMFVADCLTQVQAANFLPSLINLAQELLTAHYCELWLQSRNDSNTIDSVPNYKQFSINQEGYSITLPDGNKDNLYLRTRWGTEYLRLLNQNEDLLTTQKLDGSSMSAKRLPAVNSLNPCNCLPHCWVIR